MNERQTATINTLRRNMEANYQIHKVETWDLTDGRLWWVVVYSTPGAAELNWNCRSYSIGPRGGIVRETQVY